MNYRLTHFCLFAGHFLLFFSLAFISGYDSYILLPFLPFLPFAGIKRLALEFLLRISHFRRWLDVQLWVSFKQKQIEKQADRQKNTGTRLWSSDRINLAHQMYHSVNWPFPVKSLLNDEERGRETRKKKRRRRRRRRREKNQKNGIELRGRKHFGWIIHYRGIKKLEWHLSNRERSENKTKKNKEKERDRGEGGNVNTQFRHTGPIPTSLDVQVIESAQCFLSQTGRERGRRRNVKQELCWKNGGLHFGWIIYSIKSRSRVDLIDRNWRYRTR